MKSDTETRFLGSISTSAIRNFLPKSVSSKHKKNLIRSKSKLNRENTPPVNPNIPVDDSHVSVSALSKSPSKPSNSQKEATRPDCNKEVPAPPDSPVKVVVRIRPVNDHERDVDWTLRKVSSDTLYVGDRKFTFDSVLDSKSNQEHIFQLVGIPLVKNALAGYNASILSYGQTGSGKTYTMWGPPSAMVEEPSPSSHQGIVPRIFQMLLSEVQKEQENSEGKQINYQCRCSFLEIYNEQIGDLLDPTQRNLQIKDDAKNGFYVENLTEEYVTSYEDVTQILIKGLSSRKVGATSINSKSSRSHVVFTCVIESWCKNEGASSKCFSSSKTSRISFVDLAGMERNQIDDSSRQCARESKNVKKSLSLLGNLVNSLAKGTPSEKIEDIPYRSSCLTHLLRESLGGNAKLTVICSISSDSKSTGETLSTLRFGQRVKSIRNEPGINEITEDDVNDLSDQIRQLKEELIRAKSNDCNSVGRSDGYFKGRNVRDSLNHLRVSLNRSLILPHIDNNPEEKEVNVDEEDVEQLRQHLDYLHTSFEENFGEDKRTSCIQSSSVEESCDTDLTSEHYASCPDDSENEEMEENPQTEFQSSTIDPRFKASILINSCRQSSIFQDPPLSESPKIGNTQRKSVANLSNFLASQNNVAESTSLKRSEHIRSSLQSSKIFPGPTESLAASLQRGLQIIDYHQRNSASEKSPVAFSFEHLALKPCPEETPFLCASCQRNEAQDSLKAQVPKEELEEAIKRKTELEVLCKEHEAKIKQLNSLVEQYKHTSEINTLPLESPGNELQPIEDEDKVNQPEMIKEVREIFEHETKNTTFHPNEKEELLQEIQWLRTKLQSSSSLLSRSIQLRKSMDSRQNNEEELESERQRWTEMESDWISLTDELRIDLESNRRHAEKVECELKQEKMCTEELDDALKRAVMGHARMVEHYVELQEKHDDLAGKHRMIMEGIAEMKKAAEKAGKKGHGAKFAKYLGAELSALRVERERERELLRKENRSLRVQLRDTAEAVHAAGELLVRLREAEEQASVAEGKYNEVAQENEKLRKQMEKMKRKHKMEMITVKQCIAESRLPESALRPMYEEDSRDTNSSMPFPEDDQAWRAEFGAIYQEHY